MRQAIEQTGHEGAVVLRGGDSPLVTDGGHYIYDCALGEIAQSEKLASALLAIPGVVEHGLFIGLASAAILAGTDGLEELGAL